ncbi:MAG: response regulator receiver protein [Verrucomicrobiales bacterium]|nr:response regulator receiver protein [Verrucomicrobiales bacterium]
MTSNLFPTEQQLCTAKILIIDDEQAHVRVLEWALKQAKFANYLSVTDSTQARDEFVRYNPDLVLLDLNMPKLDGFDVLQQFQEMLPPDSFIPVLMLTGDNTSELRAKALTAGAHDFLNKPLDYTEVMLRIRNLLRTRYLFRQAQEMKAKFDLMSAASGTAK